jgi:DUF4097 and DUF4098 domain-containing protein YvlB
MIREFDLGGPLTLKVKLPAGELDVTTHDEPRAIVELEATKRNEESRRLAEEEGRVELRTRGQGHELVIDLEEGGRFGFLSWGSAELRVTVRVPHGTDLELETRSADVRVAGRVGSVAAKTASGDVSLPAVEGDVALKSASGDVEVASVRGDLAVSSASGDVQAGPVGGEVALKSASGDVRLGALSGPSASVVSASGDVTIESVHRGQVTIQSASGDLDVGIQRGSRLWVDARSMSGETSSDLEIGDAPVGDDGPLVELKATTMSGDVHVRRADAPALR